MLKKINGCVLKNESFAFETTLNGKLYEKKIKSWKLKAGVPPSVTKELL